MGASVDFSNGIKIIQEAHADAVAILEKWRSFLQDSGNITFTVKGADGSSEEIALPTIPEVINRYLGGFFEKITLARGATRITIRVNENGDVVLVDANGNPANLIVGQLAVSSINGVNGNFSITGAVRLGDVTIFNSEINELIASGIQIYNALFQGTTEIAGDTTINGNAYIRNAEIQNLTTGLVRYSKQVLEWNSVGILDTQMRGTTNNGLWTGDVNVLKRAGIYPEPTWCDCLYVPENPGVAGNTITIFWGEDGDIPVLNNGSANIDITVMVRWPYKKYEEVDGGYRIRWLPLEDQQRRISYLRTGDIGSGFSFQLPTVVKHSSTGTGDSVFIDNRENFSSYSCRRLLSDYTEGPSGSGLVTHILYPM